MPLEREEPLGLDAIDDDVERHAFVRLLLPGDFGISLRSDDRAALPRAGLEWTLIAS
jgi:hypothetical protein